MKTMLDVEQSYQKHLIAYFDMLGYRDRLNACGSNLETQADFINEFYNIFLSVLEKAELTTDYGIRKKGFSDNVILAKPICALSDTKQDILTMFTILCTLHLRCLEVGYYIRGAIEIGNLYLNDNFVSGTGLISAYDLEKDYANYSRILLSKKLIDYIEEITEVQKGNSVECEINKNTELLNKQMLYNFILKDENEDFYLNSFWFMHIMKECSPESTYYNEMPRRIKEELEAHFTYCYKNSQDTLMR